MEELIIAAIPRLVELGVIGIMCGFLFLQFIKDKKDTQVQLNTIIDENNKRSEQREKESLEMNKSLVKSLDYSTQVNQDLAKNNQDLTKVLQVLPEMNVKLDLLLNTKAGKTPTDN